MTRTPKFIFPPDFRLYGESDAWHLVALDALDYPFLRINESWTTAIAALVQPNRIN